MHVCILILLDYLHRIISPIDQYYKISSKHINDQTFVGWFLLSSNNFSIFSSFSLLCYCTYCTVHEHPTRDHDSIDWYAKPECGTELDGTGLNKSGPDRVGTHLTAIRRNTGKCTMCTCQTKDPYFLLVHKDGQC